MAARKWTAAQREQQSAAIQTWQPWRHSTGAKSAAGKAIVSRNAYTGCFRRRMRFGQWLLHARYCTATLTPKLITEVAMRADKLGVELSASNQHQQFFTDMAINNTTAAMAIDCKKAIFYYWRACVIDTAIQIVLGNR